MESMRVARPRTITLLLAASTIAAAGCEDGSQREPPPPDPAGTVREAVVRTLSSGPARIGIQVASPTVAYSVRGAIDLATEGFRVRARVNRAPTTHLDSALDVIGVGGETYQIGRGEPGLDNIEGTACAFDPHAPIGSLGGAVSVQEAVALVGVAVRLLRDGARTTRVVDQGTPHAANYWVSVDPSRATDIDPGRGDEWIVVNPSRLARHLAPMQVTLNSDGRIRRLSLELRRFPPPSRGPGLARERRRERVTVVVALSDFGRRLEVAPPSCVAME
jgi:hypothetical protein